MEGINNMEKKSRYKGFSKAQADAHKKYMEKFVEIKVRMTPEKRSLVQEHARMMGESATAFINRAIVETMEHDLQKMNGGAKSNINPEIH